MKRMLCKLAIAVMFANSYCSISLGGDDAPKSKPSITNVKADAKSKKSADKLASTSKNKVQPAKQVEMFDAMEKGLITVDFIGKDATEANIIFRNKGNEALDVVLPATFGAVPVLAQGMGGGGMMGGGGGGMGGMGGGGGGMGGMGGGGGGNQGMGGGMGGGGGGMGGGGMGGGGMGGGGMGGGGGMMGGGGGGMFRVDPDKPRKMTVATLCLEHGKADPNPRVKYKIIPLAQLNPNPEVAELCVALAHGKVSQNTAQAAAWHIANGLSWEELANKPRVVSEYTGIEYYFSQYEIQGALRLAAIARSNVESRDSETITSPGQVSSGLSRDPTSSGEKLNSKE